MILSTTVSNRVLSKHLLALSAINVTWSGNGSWMADETYSDHIVVWRGPPFCEGQTNHIWFCRRVSCR